MKKVFFGIFALVLLLGCSSGSGGGNPSGGDTGGTDTRATLSAGGAVSALAADTGKAVTFTGAAGLTLAAADFAVSGGGTITGVSVASGTATVTVTFAANTATSAKTYTVSIASGSTKIRGSATVAITQAAVAGTPPPTPPAGNPALSGSVSISGTVQVGQALSANTSSLGGSGAITYQWIRGSTHVGTNSATYILAAADVGYTIKVQVSRAGYTGTVTSGATAAVAAADIPALTGSVSISGTAQVGQALSANTGSLGGSGAISYQWIRGASTNVGTNSATYSPVAGDVGATIKVQVSRAGYTGTITSPVTAAVAAATLPALTGTVSISGTAQVGQTLTAVTSALTSPQGTPAYQWKRAGSTNIGTNATYAVVAADVGYTLTVTVSYSGNSGTVTSGATATVTLPALTGTVSITGTAQVGQTLSAVTSALTSPQGTPAYQWKRAGSTNIGTNATYAVVAEDVGSTLTVTITYSGNSGSVTSPATAAVTYPALSGTVSISGTAQVGQTLTANTGSLGGSGAITYQWIRGASISVGTNSATYVPVDADVDYTIKVQVSRAENSGTITSGATSAVLAVGSATITVGFNYGEITVSGSDGNNIISQSGAYGPTSLSLSATGYTNVIWYVDGSQTGISGSPVTINASAYTAQPHSVIFTGTANGHRYSSQPIPFVVNP
jgi:hypothetical protein